MDKVLSINDFKKSKNPIDKKIVTAINASAKYKTGYLINQQGKVIPYDKYFNIDQLPIYYVFTIDDETFKITKFKIGEKITNIKMDSMIEQIITSIRRNKI